MKRIALYIVLLAYSMVMLKPASPYIKDIFAHVFYYSKHMATVHYEHGKMHVHYEVMDNAKKEASHEEQPASKKQNTTADHTGLQQNEIASPWLVGNIFQLPLTAVLQFNYLPADYPPPRL